MPDREDRGPSDSRETGAAMAGDLDELVCLTYDELRRLAARFLNDEHPGHTLQPTALVHEAYLKLAAQNRAKWRNKPQFLAIAAQSMRRILVDHARNRVRLKRGGHQQKVSLDDATVFSSERSPDLLAFDAALTRLASIDPRQAAVVELRLYGGLAVEETAEVLKISTRSVKRDWNFAKAWLYGEMKQQYGSKIPNLGAG